MNAQSMTAVADTICEKQVVAKEILGVIRKKIEVAAMQGMYSETTEYFYLNKKQVDFIEASLVADNFVVRPTRFTDYNGVYESVGFRISWGQA